jgi:hypothetical protein
MTEFATATFPCPQCGALFALTETVAARKMQCPCGRVFVAPPLPVILPDPHPYDVTGGASPVATKPPLPKRADLYPHRSITSFSTDESEPEFSLTRDRVVPILLLCAGFALRIGEIPYDRTLNRGNFAVALALILFQLVLSTAMMLAAILISAKIFGSTFGPLGTALLKLIALSVFAFSAGAAIVIALQYEIRAIVVAIHVFFLIYCVGFAMLFSLDVQESLLTAAFCTFFQNAAAFVIFSIGK